MKIYGIDFTSRPKRSKPITCLACVLDGDTLYANELTEWPEFEAFEHALRRPGPWIAGIDFPFGQSRTFIQNIGWSDTWPGYVDHVKTLGRKGFRSALNNYLARREPGDKEHRRATDIAAGSISPQKLYGTPVGLMFCEGAPRLRDADVMIPGVQDGDPDRIVVEAYPGVMARGIIGRRSYKQDTKKKQTEGQREARLELLRATFMSLGTPNRFTQDAIYRIVREILSDKGNDKYSIYKQLVMWRRGRDSNLRCFLSFQYLA
jgi:hypothetical protein